jgi:prepilin peptidase dependent protein B
LKPRPPRGLSIVELMVGVAIGLFVVAGAAMLTATQLSDNRRLQIETQVQQDLRASADIITRELRRSGHWGKAREGVWVPGVAAVQANPYAVIASEPAGASLADGESTSTVLLSYARSGNEAAEDNVIVAAERLGFRLDSGVIQTQLGEDNWQALTDINTLRVTSFLVTMNIHPITLACAATCPIGMGTCPPVQQVREIVVDIAGRAANDATVQRSVRSSVRLRNDPVIGACPA